MHNPGKGHWQAVKWILRYIQKTVDVGLLFEREDTLGQGVIGYVDSDYAEAEYMAITEAVTEAIWLQGLLENLGLAQEHINVYCDSQCAIHLTKNQIYHARTKHIDDDIPNPGSNIEDKAKTVDDKKIQDNIEKELSSERSKMDITFVLPARCISYIISLTTPRDASRLSLACPAFKSAADLDSVWEKFLPSDYKEIISNSSSISASSLMIASLSKKDLYFYLCHNPILINNHTTSFSLVQETGKKCYMVGARGLSIAWGDSPNIGTGFLYESLVAKLREVWWFEIIARIETRILSSKTNYAAYLVFKFVKSRQGFDARPIEFDVYFEGSNNHKRRSALLDPPTKVPPQLSQDRGDGWTEIEMGEFFNENGDDGTAVCKLCESGSMQKRGIIIQGIELRPKYGK
ncbi:F-box protein PP2-B10 [Citrus sinensis]|nr:F-box protein PP2-B10 [Citrus sinensis]